MKTITAELSERTITILFLIVMFLFPTLSLSAQTKMQAGSWSVSPSLSGYSLDNNNGERSMTVEIRFDDSFINKPGLFLSVTEIDADKETNIRYNVEAISVSRDGFTLKVRTWSDSKIFSISGYWVAQME